MPQMATTGRDGRHCAIRKRGSACPMAPEHLAQGSLGVHGPSALRVFSLCPSPARLADRLVCLADMKHPPWGSGSRAERRGTFFSLSTLWRYDTAAHRCGNAPVATSVFVTPGLLHRVVKGHIRHFSLLDTLVPVGNAKEPPDGPFACQLGTYARRAESQPALERTEPTKMDEKGKHASGGGPLEAAVN